MKKIIFGSSLMILLSVALSFGVTVDGYVTNTSGGFVNGTNVTLYNATNAIVGSFLTNAGGYYNFSFDNTTYGSGVYKLNYSATGYQNASTNIVIPNSNSTSKQINQTMALVGPTTGFIEGIVSSASGALPNASIVAADSTNYVTTTNSTGGYRIEVGAGLYNITASFAGYVDAKSLNQTVIAGNTLGINFTLNLAIATIQGTVKDSSDNSSVSSASVELKQGTSTVNTTTTNASGFYSLNSTVGSSFNITVAKSGYVSSTQSVTLTLGSTTTQNVTLTPLGTLTGTLTNGASAAVTLKQSGSTISSTTAGSDGVYSVTVPIGTYDIEVTKSGFNSATATVTITKSGASFSTTLSSTSSTTGGNQAASTSTSISVETPTKAVTISSLKSGVDYTAKVETSNSPLTEIVVKTKADLPSAKIEVFERTSKPASVTELSNVYKYTEVKTDINASNLDKVEFKFKVTKSWLDQNKFTKESVSLARFNSGWQVLTTQVLSEDSTNVYYKSDSPGFSVFAVFANQSSVATQNQTTTPPTVYEPANTSDIKPSENQTTSTGTTNKTDDTKSDADKKEPANESGSFAIIYGTIIIVVIIVISLAHMVKGRKASKKKR